MVCPRIHAALGMAALCAAILTTPAAAATLTVAAGDDLRTVLAGALPGDIVRLEPGHHAGPLVIDKALTLEGEPGAVLIGNGEGNVLTVDAADAIVRGLEISGSGDDLEAMSSGIFLTENAAGAVIEDNAVLDNLYGINIHGAAGALVKANHIVGRRDGRLNEFGNGVSVWNATGAQVIGNDISFGRDGIFSNASKQNVFSGNRFTDVRFAVHYMYTNDSEISDNVSIGNAAGYAIMFSDRLRILRNRSEGDRDHGLLLNYANGSEIADNVVIGREQPISRWLTAGSRTTEHGVSDKDAEPATADAAGMRLGPEKCVFIYNANGNRFTGNWFEGCATGIHFTAGSERNTITGNAFVGNRNQVKYVGGRYLDWSVDGRGNYWSDNPAFDLDGDGIADSAYRPNDIVDTVLWTAPQAKLLVNSPAVQVLRWAQAQFPALLPGGVVDNHPLMAPATTPQESVQ